MDMLFDSILPIGSIVKLKNEEKSRMIVGYCPNDIQDDIKIYVGVEYPLGLRNQFLLNQNYFTFNPEDIEDLLFLGHQDQNYEEYARLIKNVLRKIKVYKENNKTFDNKTLFREALRENIKIIEDRENKNE